MRSSSVAKIEINVENKLAVPVLYAEERPIGAHGRKADREGQLVALSVEQRLQLPKYRTNIKKLFCKTVVIRLTLTLNGLERNRYKGAFFFC